MKILIKDALVLHPGSPHHQKKKDILINNGKIIEIGQQIREEGTLITGKKLMVSVGWFDMRANFNDPGNEHKEDIISGGEAAAAGGFTGVAILPNTRPALQSKNDISYVISKSENGVPAIYPYGSITRDNKGEEITEMIDQHTAGAIAFTDGEHTLWNTDIMMKALLYVKKFNGLIINKPEDKWLNFLGNMHEGSVSTMLGLKGMPSIAEDIAIERDLRILGYTGGRLHFSNISTANAVKLIRNAKKSGLDVTCDVAAHQMAFDDQVLLDFDTSFKVNPPFRDTSDNKALIRGLEDGTIDVMVSSHTPHDTECKKLEFDLADFGIIGLQTFYPIMVDLFGEDGWKIFLDKITVNPRKRLNLKIHEIREGAEANLTVFDPTVSWTFSAVTNKSKSVNSPFWNKKMQGKVIAVINKNKSYIAR
ncbi:MAG: dihydroorotase [Cyclobacteriaceae bacterium]|nr:dihydroorotase [Cyclobacteriaceae bacterium]